MRMPMSAMACGTPVVAFNRGSIPEVVDEGLTGFIVEDEEDLVAMRAPGEEDIAQRRRGVFPGPRRPAADDDGLHFQG